MSKRRHLLKLFKELHKHGHIAMPGATIMRAEGTVGMGIFGRKEKAEEDAWIRRLEADQLHRIQKTRNVAGDAGMNKEHAEVAARTKANAAVNTAIMELDKILQMTRHIAPDHVKAQLINWRLGNEHQTLNIAPPPNLPYELGEVQGYDYNIEKIPITPTSGPGRYEYDSTLHPKVDKRTKEYKTLKKRIEEKAVVVPADFRPPTPPRPKS